MNEYGEAAFFTMLDRVRSGYTPSPETKDGVMPKHIRLTGAYFEFTACGRVATVVLRNGGETAHFPYGRITQTQAEKIFTCPDCIAAWYDDEAT